MALPSELVDEILIHLQHDKQALQNCSLVARSWAHSSQKLLFVSANLTPKTYQKWREEAPPASAEVLQNVRTLTCLRFYFFGILDLDSFRSLHHLQRLTLREIVHIEPNTPNIFLVFQDTLSSLSLDHVSLAWSTFTSLIDYFPNLRELNFGRSSFETGYFPVPSLSRPPRGKLSLSMLPERTFHPLSRQISQLELEYDELEMLDLFDQTGPLSHVEHIISACKKTLERLRVDLLHCE